MNILLVELLKKARLNCNLTQKEVAARLNIKDNTLSNWEKGRTEPDIDTFVKLCEIYNVNCADLLEQAYRLKAKEYTIQQKNVIEAYVNNPDMQAAVNKLLDVDDGVDEKKDTIELMPGEYAEYMKDRNEFIRNRTQPFAAAGGDVSNLDEAQEDYDNARAKEEKENE